MANSDDKLLEKPKIEESIAKLKEIQSGLRQNLSQSASETGNT